MKRIFMLVLCMLGANAYAWDLHYGEYAVGLTETKNTSPALHIRLNENETIYGAMYDAVGAPKNTIRIMFEGTEYFVGNWCDAGTWQSPDALECVDCGIGHYCTGGVHRAPCAGGAIACPGKNHTTDATAPAALVNKILSLDEVNTNIPATDWSDWKEVSCCSTHMSSSDATYNPNVGCPITKFGPGTYLFVTYGTFDGVCETKSGASRNMAIIAQPSSFKQVHYSNHFYTHVDTTSTDFKTTSFIAKDVTGDAGWCHESNNTNISNMNYSSSHSTMCVYELK